MGNLRDRLTLLAYSGGWSAVRHLPERAAYATFRRIADGAWRKRGAGVRRLEANYARALGTTDEEVLRATSREGMRSYLRYWCDAFRLPDWDAERTVARVRVENSAALWDNLAAGGVVVTLPHMGNWDHAGAWGCLSGARVTTVAERLEPEELYERFLEFRRGLGMEILPASGGSDDVFATLAKRLNDGGLVPLVADRDLSRRGVDVTLFGEATRMPAGPAALALRTGSALVPATLWYEGSEPDHQLVVRFHDQIARPEGVRGAERVSVMTQAVADVFSAGIAEHPHAWHMLQPFFLSDLPPDDSRRAKVTR